MLLHLKAILLIPHDSHIFHCFITWLYNLACSSAPFPAYIHYVNYKQLRCFFLGYPLLSLLCRYSSKPIVCSTSPKIYLTLLQLMVTTQFSDIHCTDRGPLTIFHTNLYCLTSCVFVCSFNWSACSLKIEVTFYISYLSGSFYQRTGQKGGPINTWLVIRSFKFNSKPIFKGSCIYLLLLF